jgi:hypothetical protein
MALLRAMPSSQSVPLTGNVKLTVMPLKDVLYVLVLVAMMHLQVRV